MDGSLSLLTFVHVDRIPLALVLIVAAWLLLRVATRVLDGFGERVTAWRLQAQQAVAVVAAASSWYVYLNKPIQTVVREVAVAGAEMFATKITVKAYVLDGRYEVAFGTDVTERVKRALRDGGVRTAGRPRSSRPFVSPRPWAARGSGVGYRWWGHKCEPEMAGWHRLGSTQRQTARFGR
jgi:hypothetical protein